MKILVPDDVVVHCRIAEGAMRQALTFRGIDAAAASVVVRRRKGGLDVKLQLPDGVDRSTNNAVAIVVHDALRQFDPNGIDIAIAS